MSELRKSEKREQILELFKKKHIITAKEIVDILKDRLDRATVYRNLKFFVKEGMIRELKLDKDFLSYELNHDSHQHFKCKNCENVYPIHVSDRDITALIKNHKVESIEINAAGICEKCFTDGTLGQK